MQLVFPVANKLMRGETHGTNGIADQGNVVIVW